ncbi:MAG: squalene synthase HpnC [Parvularcula sp.]|jgi:squalene synthase HpnC|nr:squalene synthase HpnC [Parvularcula sp.]
MTISYRDADIEAPSGKGAKDENFPVGSFLIAPPLRGDVAAYYAFARAADDIGDDPALSAEEKIRRLDALAQVLSGEATGLTKAEALKASFQARNIPLARGLDLLSAFCQDAVKNRYASLAELEDYCARSAEPVGRFLLDLHGESPALYPASDGLCTALQILNHLQDAKNDLADLDRCYLPGDWLEENHARVDDVQASALTPALRRVYDRLLDVCAEHLKRAEDLVTHLRSRRLAAESAVILRLARRLETRLRAADPLAGRVALTKSDFLSAGAAGMWEGAFRSRSAA